ncbi:MAG: DUF454 domain-containing protein [Armatimonadetes bacterium]|nr:DUF454 domain-containing protein [Armatimonadota bacterium]
MEEPSAGTPRGALLIGVGWALVGLGAVGLVVPLMPATPFLLLAAWCFARSSPRFHGWLMRHRVFGQLILAYRERRGMTPRQKAATILSLWLTLGISAVVIPAWWARVVLGAVGFGVTAHILRMRTRRAQDAEPACPDPAVE